MKFTSAALLFGLVTLDRASSELSYTFSKGKGKGYNNSPTAGVPPPPAPPVPSGQEIESCYSPYGTCKQCKDTNNGCTMRVDVDCTYRDANQVLRSCIGDKLFTTPPNNAPFKTSTVAECNKNPPFLQATIRYRMCNDNEYRFNPSANTFIKFKGISQTPFNWDASIAPFTCREHIITTMINPCRDPPYQAGIVISVAGNLAKSGPNYCFCFNKEISRTSVLKPLTLAPVPAPPPQRTDECNLSDVIITELASPEQAFAKYIELFFYKCKGVTIDRDLKIVHYAAGSVEPSNTVINLRGYTIREDGFFTICVSEHAESYYGRGSCTHVSGFASPANLRGTETIAIVEGDIIDDNIIDIFGVPGTGPGESEQNFKNGRAVRVIDVFDPVPYFDPVNWHVFPGKCKQEVGPGGMDINEWKDVQGPICPGDVSVIITEIVDLDVPSLTEVPRYVELYAPRLRDRGQGLNVNLKLVVFRGAETEPHWLSAIPIDYIPENGFLTVCNAAAAEKYGYECAIKANRDSYSSPANSAGNDNIALISGDQNGWFIVDIYGVIGEDGYDTDHYFRDSRVIRKLDVTSTRSTWSKDDWQICKGDTPDINKWDSDECFSALDAPSAPPTSQPTTEAQKNCEFFFTELSDLEDKAFVEIKSTCPGTTISRDITVTSYKEYGVSCQVDLKGMVVPDDGFIIICRNKIQHALSMGSKHIYDGNSWRDVSVCDIEDYILLAGHGSNSYTIVDQGADCGDNTDCVGGNCNFGCNDKTLDIYGFPENSLEDTIYKYNGCRVVRKMHFPYGVPRFDFDMYELICPSDGIEPQPGEDCDPREWKEIPLVLYFTEFCDPKDNGSHRFIELYSPNKKNYKIKDDLIIMKWEGTNPYPSTSFQPLKGKVINENGFLVLCINWDVMSSEVCDVQTGFNSIVNSPGDSHYALAKCQHPGESCIYIDRYGFSGTDDTAHDFSQGRASRRKHFGPYPNKMFNPSQWVIETKVTADQCDPGVCVDPPAPSPTPGSKPSGGYSPSKGKSKNKRLR